MPKRDLFAKLSFFIFSSDVILTIRTKNIIESFIRKNHQFSTHFIIFGKNLKITRRQKSLHCEHFIPEKGADLD